MINMIINTLIDTIDHVLRKDIGGQKSINIKIIIKNIIINTNQIIIILIIIKTIIKNINHNPNYLKSLNKQINIIKRIAKFKKRKKK